MPKIKDPSCQICLRPDRDKIEGLLIQAKNECGRMTDCGYVGTPGLRMEDFYQRIKDSLGVSKKTSRNHRLRHMGRRAQRGPGVTAGAIERIMEARGWPE